MTKKLIPAVFLLFMALPAKAQIAFVQAKSAQAAGATAVTVTITTTANNLLVICAYEGANNSSTVTISDSASQSWTQAGGYNSSSTSDRQACWYKPNSASVTSVKATWSGPLNNTLPAVVYEISGADTSSPLDSSVTSSNSATGTSLGSGSLTTTNANDILLYCVDENSTTTGFSQGAGFTLPTGSFIAGGGRIAMSYEIVSATQSGTTTTMSWTTTGTLRDGFFLAFKQAGGGAAPAGINKRLKLEQYDNGMAISTGGGMQISANVLGLLFGPCDPADKVCSESLEVCFADGTCHVILVGDKAATVSIVKNWSPGGVPQTLTTPVLSLIALPNAAVP